MTNIIDNILKNLGITLPTLSAPVASYAPFVQSSNLVIISGQLPIQDGKPSYLGKIGHDFTTEDGQKCAYICGLNILSQLKNSCDGDLSKVKKCVRLGVFVNSTENYIDHPKVANGVSDLMVEVFGKEIGSHARAAVGVSSLPLGVAVEVEAMFEIK